MINLLLIYQQDAHSAYTPVFKLFGGGDFEAFCPEGRHIVPTIESVLTSESTLMKRK